MARKLAAVAFSLGCLQAGSVSALGLGELSLESFLNEPLKASVDLINVGGLQQDEIKIRLATRDDFEKMGLDRAYFLTNITFEVTSDENGNPQIELSSEEAVLEPYLDFIVEARWPSGRLLREYTVLIDPPVFSEADAPAVSASQRVEEVEGIPAVPKKKVTETGTTGTTVDVRKSALAPDAMPQRNFNAAAADAPSAGSRYMVSRNDTLWDIATDARPEGASVHQTMLDIQRLNPEAFINGNINRVKAGYILYLPSAGDISSGDLVTALAEVKEQNAAWREGRDAQMHSSRGPALRISADPEGEAVSDSSAAAVTTGTPSSTVDSADMTAAMSAGTAGLDSAEQERIAAMQQQVETLQRIVSLKDAQIAALQSALSKPAESAEMTTEGDAGRNALTDMSGDTLEEEDAVTSLDGPDAALGADESRADDVEAVDAVAAALAGSASAAAPEVAAKPAPIAKPPAQPAESGGIMDYILYLVGAGILALAGFLFFRRKGNDDGAVAEHAVQNDVFSDIELHDDNLEVDADHGLYVDETIEEEPAGPDSRGYGEHKNDGYASDGEATDALAEADIYVAYGRHSQAIELLNNAVANEPDNPVYRLKLIEIYTDQNDRGAATAQLEQLQSIGDADTTARAESIMAGASSAGASATNAEPAPAVAPRAPATEDAPGLSPNPLEMMGDSGSDEFESDFSGLEIESGDAFDADDELDLSADFDAAGDAGDDEELLIAADANGMSTKLDLARAYHDMGDDDGARQILDEVVAEGSDELKAEAQTLLDSIG